ncbi:ELMO domain-containing protein 2 [Quaeritorhiza haematococci]|nr:ELMO domain-containing protein 2 [Quaeritorhiza haematococci]
MLWLAVALLAAALFMARSARSRYGRFGFDFPPWIVTLVLNLIYQYEYLLWLYKIFKAVYRFLTQTSELYRICDGVAAQLYNTQQEQQQKSFSKSSGETAVQSTSAGGGGISEETELKQLKKSANEPLQVEGVQDAMGGVLSSDSTIARLKDDGVAPLLIYRIDRCLLYSTKLKFERRQLEAKEGDLSEPFALILKKKLFPENGNPSTPHAIILRQCLSTISATYKLVHELNARAATKYDSTNKLHEKKLLELWDLMMPNEKLSARVTKQWQQIGFQGDDPATDFRGMGVLGLDDLHYYAKHHPGSCQRVLRSSHQESWFSMAIVGINITGFALELVRTRQLQLYFYTYGTSKDVYHEFYCYLFDNFEKHWTSQSTPLTVMDFGRVFKEFQGIVERDVMEQKATVLDPSSPVFARNKKKK